MTPNKKIYNHSFLHGLGELKFFGDKGNSYMEAGYIFAPYIPMAEPSEFRPRRSMMSRYAERVVNNSFYGVIEHDGA